MSTTRTQLNDFFVSVQGRALKQVEFSVKNRDDSFDILQDAMIRLAKNYSDKNDDWPKLFQRILQNLIVDWHRRQKVRSIFVWWQRSKNGKELGEEEGDDQYSSINEGIEHRSPEHLQSNRQLGDSMSCAIEQLPLRQQQAFTLRAWWGHNVKETAFAMGCSEGSVKTHYFRATVRLRELLGDYEQ